MTAIERFMRKVAMVPIAGCWIWTSCSEKNSKFDYGTFYLGKKFIRAHLASWQLHYGPIPPGMKVCHQCDVPGCVNPDHLFLGTSQENMRDMVDKGRGRHFEVAPRGEAHHKTTLADTDVLQIRSIYAGGGVSQAQLGKQFGVSQSSILKIVRRQRWGHV